MSHIILNCFKSLNQNNLKVEDDGLPKDDETTVVLDATIAAKVEEEQAFQNFMPEEPNDRVKANALFKKVFSVCK